jgi:hypothetical protein
MKKFCLTITIAVFYFIFSAGVQAQNPQPAINQVGLLKQFIGTWQASTGKDTVETWVAKLYGEAIIINLTREVKGIKSPVYVNNIGFDKGDGKIKGFALFPNTDVVPWVGQFTTEKNFGGELVGAFDSKAAWAKFEFAFSPDSFMFTMHNMEGVKTSEYKFSKVK